MPDGRPICPICYMTFARFAIAKRHFEVKHTGVKFKCEKCDSEFGRKDILKTHLMSKHSLPSAAAKLLTDKA